MKRIVNVAPALVVAACAASHEQPILVETPGRTGVVMPIESPSMEDGIRRAVGDLSARLAVPAEAIRVVSARPVDWPSSAIGCPEAGRMYMTVLTPGVEVVLEARGVEYHYHAASQGAPFLCPDGRREPPAGFRD